MHLTITKASILGATGSLAWFLVPELIRRGMAVRVVSRDLVRLAHLYPDDEIERLEADLTQRSEAHRAVEGCDLVFHCVGVPFARFEDHLRCAENVTAAIRACGARCVQVSSYWSYMPLTATRLTERHKREGGPRAAQIRRQAEDTFLNIGAAVAQLPDFFGPYHVHSTLQRALDAAARGKTIYWIGPATAAREYVYLPDGARALAELALRPRAYGERWLIPGCGAASLQEILKLAAHHLGRECKVRTAAHWQLGLLRLFSADLRGFLPLARDYSQPLEFDASNFCRLVGEWKPTPYNQAVPATLDWLRSRTAAD